MRIEPDPRLSLMRPAWTSEDLYAYRHLHLRDRMLKDHFVSTHGFRTKQDYDFAKRRR